MVYSSVVLVILDGFGVAPAWGGNAIIVARVPTIAGLEREPHAVLEAAGEAVGLGPNEPGNSEVGHLNLGAGRIVVQESRRISQALADRTFFENAALIKTFAELNHSGGTLHLMGLLSPVGIHAVYAHLLGVLEMAQIKSFFRVKLHLFTDGRDSGQRDALALLLQLEQTLQRLGFGTIQTISGRYYAMDRDNHWDRTKLAYEAVGFGRGQAAASARQALSQAYAKEQTDEFINPTVVNKPGQPVYAGVQNQDVVMFFNCRADRARQLTRAFTDSEIHETVREQLAQPFTFVSMVPYDLPGHLNHGRVVFEPPPIYHSLPAVIAERGGRQFHIAETEKWAHITYFFNGRLEALLPGEERLLIPSPKVPTYDTAPAMSADTITRELVNRISRGKEQLIVANYANADMVGHTGNFRAALLAVEVLDRQLRILADTCQKHNVPLIITADHGNVEEMVDPQTGEVDTEHSLNPVPCYFVLPAPQRLLKARGLLADVAPTILALLGEAIPVEMTGSSLLGEIT